MKRITTLLLTALFTYGAFGAITVPDQVQLGQPKNYISNGGIERGVAGFATYFDGGTFTSTGSGTTLTAGASETLSVGAVISFSTTGTLPAPLVVGNDYFVLTTPSNTTFTIATSATGTTPVTFTTAGSGTHTWRPKTALVGTGGSPAHITMTAGAYTFTITSNSATAGATYTDSTGQTFTVSATISSQTTLQMTGTGIPATSGNLTKVSGTGGSTIAYSSVISPLKDTRSLRMVNSGSTSARGEGISYDFSIDAADQAQVINVSFDYSLVSGTFLPGSLIGSIAESDIEVFVYDKTNGVILQPSSYILTCGASINIFCNNPSIQFQSASNSTNYRLLFHVATSSTSAWTMAIDNIVASRMIKQFGSPVTNVGSLSWTPTGTWTTNTSYTGAWRRNGDRMEGWFKLLLSGAPNAATNLTVNMPSGYTMDTTKMNAATNNSDALGFGHTVSGGSTYPVIATFESSTVFRVRATGPGTGASLNFISPTGPATYANGDVVVVSFSVPIVGWGSNLQTSDVSGGRVVAARYTTTLASGTFSNNVQTPLNFNTMVYDTHGAVTTGGNSTSVQGGWKFTVPEAGFYTVTGSFHVDNLGSNAGLIWLLLKNGTVVAQKFTKNSTNVTDIGVEGVATQYCNAGDTLALNILVGGGTVNLDTSNAINWIEINKVQGPSTIGAAESVNATYTTSAAQTFTSSTFTTMVWGTKLFDSHNAMNTSSGLYTVPLSGKYRVHARATWNSAGAVSQRQMFLVQSGSASVQFNGVWGYNVAGQGSFAEIDAMFNCLAGDTLIVQGYQASGGNLNLDGNGGDNFVNIQRIGN